MENAVEVNSHHEENVKPKLSDLHFVSNGGKGQTQYFAKRTQHSNVIGPWWACTLKGGTPKNNTEGRLYSIIFTMDDLEVDVAEYDLAKDEIPAFEELDKLGTRVIAKRRKEFLPYTLNERNERVNLFSDRDNAFFPGIIARDFGNDEYCIFFDDGVVCYVIRSNIRLVLGNDTHKHAHWNARIYFEFYTSKEQSELVPEALKVGHELKIELNGDPIAMAKVLEVDRILAKVQFLNKNRVEWIYLGSPRISQIYRELIKRKRLDEYIVCKTYKPCRSADVVVIDSMDEKDVAVPSTSYQNGRAADGHICTNECVHEKEKFVNLDVNKKYLWPLWTGWSIEMDPTLIPREPSFYRSPCGIPLNTLIAIEAYLEKTNSKLAIDCFDLGKNIVIKDISGGVENKPIPVCGRDMTDEQKSFNYISGYNFKYVDVDKRSDLEREGCNCKDNCSDKANCSCWRLTVQRTNKRIFRQNEFEKRTKIGYNNMKLTDIVKTGIVECGSKCKCCAKTCVNRVVQRGLQVELELFWATDKGWGVRTANDLLPATFICSYAGDILEDSIADKRISTKYQFKLPKNDNDDISDSDNESPKQPPPPKKRLHAKRHTVLQAFVNYFPPINDWNTKNLPESEDAGERDSYIIDALHHGNVSRFFNHSCDPNLFAQKVFVEIRDEKDTYDDTRFPMIAFFTRSSIKAGTELTFDYKYELNDNKRIPCLCGAANCRKRLI